MMRTLCLRAKCCSQLPCLQLVTAQGHSLCSQNGLFLCKGLENSAGAGRLLDSRIVSGLHVLVVTMGVSFDCLGSRTFFTPGVRGQIDVLGVITKISQPLQRETKVLPQCLQGWLAFETPFCSLGQRIAILILNHDDNPGAAIPVGSDTYSLGYLTFEGFFPHCILLFECLLMLNFGHLIAIQKHCALRHKKAIK